MIRSDDEVRRETLADANWQPHEIDAYLAANPKPQTLAEQAAIFSERFHDALFALVSAIGVVALSRRLGMKPRPWAARRMS